MPAARRSVIQLGALALLATACDHHPKTPSAGDGLDAVFARLVAGLSPSGPYRDPRASERQAAREAIRTLTAQRSATGDVDDRLDGIAFAVTHGTDAAPDGRPFTLYLSPPGSEPAWGGLLVDRSTPIRSVIEVPHPGFDRNTELLGLSLYRAVPGAVLMIAGAHRQADHGNADVAHNKDSMFNLVSREFARAGLPQLQWHGFAESSLPGSDFVVSTGAAPHTDLPVRIATELAGAGYRVCQAWSTRCQGLEGNTNVQGAAAAKFGSTFVHLETGWSMRQDPAHRQAVVDAVARAWRTA